MLKVEKQPMKKNSRRFKRSVETREYRKVFNVFMEGRKTEPLYFEILKRQCDHVSILLHPSTTKTDPNQILIRAKRHIKKNGLDKNEEAWIVVDVDNRNKSEFDALFVWRDENKQHGLGISNPSFEYWLLLHFDHGDSIKNITDCISRLRQHIPNFKKNNLGISRIDYKTLDVSIKNAKRKDEHCEDWHVDNYSTVYLLIKKILSEEKRKGKSINEF